MAKLNAAARKRIPSSQFGLPGKRAYPMPDKAHAANAKARASQFASPSEKAKIDAKANRILHNPPGGPDMSKMDNRAKMRKGVKNCTVCGSSKHSAHGMASWDNEDGSYSGA